MIIITIIAQFLINTFGIEFETAKKYAGWVVLAAVAIVLILVFSIFGYFSSCSDRRAEKKLENLNANISAANTDVKILTNQKQNLNADVLSSAENSNKAAAAVNSAANANLSGFGSDYNKANDRFCEVLKDCR